MARDNPETGVWATSAAGEGSPLPVRAGRTSLRSATCRESPLISSLATHLAPFPIHTHLHLPYCRPRAFSHGPASAPKDRYASAPLSSSTICPMPPSHPPWASQRLALSVAISPVVYSICCCMSLLPLGLIDTTEHTTHAPIAVTLVAFSPLSSLLPAACPWAHGRRVRVSICRSSDYITALSRLQIVRLPNILQCPTCVCPTRNCHVTLAHEECTQPSCQSEYPEYHQHAIFPLSVGILQTMCAIATVTSM